jgi:hypothetical protein
MASHTYSVVPSMLHQRSKHIEELSKVLSAGNFLPEVQSVQNYALFVRTYVCMYVFMYCLPSSSDFIVGQI